MLQEQQNEQTPILLGKNTNNVLRKYLDQIGSKQIKDLLERHQADNMERALIGDVIILYMEKGHLNPIKKNIEKICTNISNIMSHDEDGLGRRAQIRVLTNPRWNDFYNTLKSLMLSC